MREPSRFAERDDMKGRLLRAARGEPSPDRSRRRAAAAVIAASTLVTSTTATTAAAGSAAAVVTKWLVAGAVVATLGGGAAVVVHQRIQGQTPAAAHAVASRVETARPALRAASQANAAPVETTAPPEPTAAPPGPSALQATPPAAPTEPPPVAVPPRAVIASVPSATGGSAEGARPPLAREPAHAPSLTDELVALDSAKRLLDQGDSAGVLIALDRYARDFPAGRLQPEALALRAEALERHGDHALAMHLYERLAREYPESPLCERVRAIVGAPPR
jgi:TolA-binding protein